MTKLAILGGSASHPPKSLPCENLYHHWLISILGGREALLYARIREKKYRGINIFFSYARVYIPLPNSHFIKKEKKKEGNIVFLFGLSLIKMLGGFREALGSSYHLSGMSFWR